MRPTEAVIDLAALRANFAVARERAHGCEVIGVVKADAYGHGASAVARALAGAGCTRLAVVTTEEGVALRDAGLDLPILILGGLTAEDEAAEAVSRDLTPVLHDPGPVRGLSRAADGSGIAVQVEVDTGMHRMGVPCDSALALLQRVCAAPGLQLEGLYTHLARADEADLEPSRLQLQRFRALRDDAHRAGIEPPMLHFANSAGLLVGAPLRDLAPESNAVRPGLMLYGVSPAPHLEAPLQPVMTLRTRVAHVRDVPKGGDVGYAALYRAPRDTRVATLPLGYEDGVPIAASNRGSVCIRGRRFPLVGRVSMDYVTVDVSDAPVAAGDEVVVFGGRGDMHLSVEEAADAAGTIAYELLVRVGSRVPRRWN